MKILDRYILTSFLRTFASVFVILFFIFILQGIWLFIAELAGKDLDAWLVIKFLLFYSPKIVPLVLPLSILLASIMTFGNFAENYEFAAMKSSGISLKRAMQSLIIFIFCLSITAFFFANNVIPKAEYKFINLRKSIIQRKPAMAIVEGQFNAIGNFNIKVDKKTGENGEKLEGVTIHKRNPGTLNTVIIRAKNGLLKSAELSNLLQLELFDGYYYEEIKTTNSEERQKQPFAKSSFSKQVMNIDLSKLNTEDGDDEEIAHTNSMLTVSELNYTLDSLENNFEKEAKSITENLVQRTNTVIAPIRTTKKQEAETVKDSVPKELLSIVNPESEKIRILESAINNIDGSDYSIVSGKSELNSKIKNINSHWLALYDKFVIAFACILMFFIGAPLGAIIRKGGLGLPIVFAVLIFIIFHFINTFGKKLAQENGITPFLGAWMSSIVLSPLAVLLTYRATNDIGLISMDNILVALQKFFIRKKNNKEESSIIKLDTIKTVKDQQWYDMNNLKDNVLIGIVKNAKQYNYSYDYRIKALKILESRGVTQEELLARGELFNARYEKIQNLLRIYRNEQKVIFIAYILSIAFSGAAENIHIAFVLVSFINISIFYIYIAKSENTLNEIGKLLNRKIGIGLIWALTLGIFLYIFIFLYERKLLKEALSELN